MRLLLQVRRRHVQPLTRTMAFGCASQSVIQGKLEASGLIEELLEQTGHNNGRGRQLYGHLPDHLRQPTITPSIVLVDINAT
jgi:hypothetical protein